MESRKIIGFGKSSAVVTLPKDWLQKNKLQKGSNLHFKDEGDRLLLSPGRIVDRKVPKKAVIETNNKELGPIKKEIIGAYLNAHDIIELKGANISQHANDIKEVLHNLMALEVMEQTKYLIVAKDFLQIEDISFDDILRRIHRIAQSILEEAAPNSDQDCYESIIEKDFDVNRLFFLIHRAVIYAFDNPNIRKKLRRTPIELLNDWLVVNCIENISDYAKYISMPFSNADIPKDVIKELRELYTETSNEYAKVMEAFFRQDKRFAHEVSERAKIHIQACNDFYKKHSDHNIVNILEYMKGMQVQIGQIAISIINSKHN